MGHVMTSQQLPFIGPPAFIGPPVRTKNCGRKHRFKSA